MADDKPNEDTSTKLTAETKDSNVPLNLGDGRNLDLQHLTPEQQQEISLKVQEAKIDLAKKAEAAKIDLHVTKTQIDNLSESSLEATKDGTSFTATHSQDTSVGRTEVVIGNTERAAKGKMSRSGAGLPDIDLKIGLIIGVVIVMLALIFGG